MSYYKMRSFHLNKDGNPVISVADSSVYPRHYFSHTMKDSPDPIENVEKLCVDMLSGNIQPDKTKDMYSDDSRPGKVLELMQNLIKTYAPAVDFERDLELKLNTWRSLESYIAGVYGAKLLRREQPDMTEVAEGLQQFNREAKATYKERMQEYKDKGIVTVRSASMSDVFPGYDVLFNANADECIIAKQENYHNNGLLDNSDNSAVFLGNTSGRLYHALSSGPLSETRMLQIKDALEDKLRRPVRVMVEPDYLKQIAETGSPKGLFFAEDNGKWQAVNSTGRKVISEMFSDKKDALAFLNGDSKCLESWFVIYQLKDTEELRDLHFADYGEVTRSGNRVSGSNYEKMYEGRLTHKSKDDNVVLEDIFEDFNIDRPDDFYGHSLSVSDVVVLHRAKGMDKAYYLDSFGFKELKDFKPEPISSIIEGVKQGLKARFADKESFDTPLTVGLDYGTVTARAEDVIEGLGRAQGKAYYEKDPEINIKTGIDVMGRPLTATVNFSDIQNISYANDNPVLYETPADRNKRLFARRSVEQEVGITR